MRWRAFRSATRPHLHLGDLAGLILGSLLAAAAVPLLLVDLGLLVQLFLTGGAPATSSTLVSGEWTAPFWSWPSWWPSWSSPRLTLLLLVSGGLALALIWTCGRCLVAWYSERAATRVAAAWKTRILDHAARIGPVDLLGGRRMQPERLFTSHVERLRAGVATAAQVPLVVLTLVLLLALVLTVNYWLALLATLTAVFIGMRDRSLRRHCRERSMRWRERSDLAHQKLMDRLRLTDLVAEFWLPRTPGGPVEEPLGAYERAQTRSGFAAQLHVPLLGLFVFFATGFLILVVGLSPDITLAGSIVLGTALLVAYWPSKRLLRMRGQFDMAEEAAAALQAFELRTPHVHCSSTAEPLPQLAEVVHFDGVTLAGSRGGKLLDGVHFDIDAGSRVALVSPDRRITHALAGLFVRLYDPAAGRIMYDGRDIQEGTLESVRRQAILVAEDPLVFPGTIADNITCGDPEPTLLQIIDAVKQARAFNLVQELPDGINTVIGEGGWELSPGQAFRIGLARAFLRDPALLVVMEPRGSLDPVSLGHLDEALRLAAPRRTVILVPTRLSTLRQVDRVMLFDKGRLLDEGGHFQLLERSALYRHLNYIRFNAFGGAAG